MKDKKIIIIYYSTAHAVDWTISSTSFGYRRRGQAFSLEGYKISCPNLVIGSGGYISLANETYKKLLFFIRNN